MDNILSKIVELEKALAQINQKRNEWIQSTKETIYSTLFEIKQVKKLDWQVQKVQIIKNSETVNLIFNKSASGIIQSNINGHKHFEKHGGGLFFAQSYNGNIFVFIEYPYVENLVGQIENKLLEKISPEKINKDYVIDKVSIFLDEMTKWESSANFSRLGYK